ncbi:hypothetical protein TWF679_000199 [Orbilia oligospora]|uniref:Peptidase A1 domain-containing protein n=1 Tax=Orbilia oligospora TaxID=2813651 RepID=A0A8H8VNC3_ORBOL|nr:hypothetical protein TWF679_000199 [Orbilia oligospora]
MDALLTSSSSSSSFFTTIVIIILILFTTNTTSTINLPQCKTPPWPVIIKFSFLPLGPTGRPNIPPAPVGYGLQMYLGGERFAPRIEVLESPEIKVSEVRLKCNITNPKDCGLDASYDINTEILAGGVYSSHQLQEEGGGGRVSNTSTSNINSDDYSTTTTETLSLGGRNLQNFTFQVDKRQLSPATRGVGSLVSSYIGLGVGSKLLERLLDDGMIVTRAWSFFPGWIGTEKQVGMIKNGGLVIGGYDAGLIGNNSKFVEFPINVPSSSSSPPSSSPSGSIEETNCPFPIEISQINWLGQKAINDTIEGRRPFKACINPGSNKFEFPYDIWEKMMNSTYDAGLGGYPSFEGIYDRMDKRLVGNVNPILPVDQNGLDYFGFQEIVDWGVTNTGTTDLSMTIHLSNGLHLTIPSTQIFQRRRYFSPQNIIETYGIENYTIDYDYRTAVITYPPKSSNSQKIPTFGIPFLTSAYFMANYDTLKFGLAPINTSSSMLAAQQNRLIRTFLPVECIPPSTQKARALEARVIAPAVIGAFAVFCVAILVGVYRAQRRYSKSIKSMFLKRWSLNSSGGGGEKGMGGKDGEGIQEMDATKPFEHELDSRCVYELPVPVDCWGRVEMAGGTRSVKSKKSFYELP